MAQPPDYSIAHEFLGDESRNVNFPGTELDIEFNSIKATLDALLDNLALIQRDDGELTNESVHWETLDDELRQGVFAPLSAWVEDEDYRERQLVATGTAIYRCLVDHHSTSVFANDLGAGKWVLVVELPTGGGGGDGTVTTPVTPVVVGNAVVFGDVDGTELVDAGFAPANAVHTHDDRYYTDAEVDTLLAAKLNSASYTAADVLAKLLTVDGAGSGLDADLLDGLSSTAFAAAVHTHDDRYYTDAEVDTLLSAKLNSASYTAADVLAKLLTVDGAGSGLDADLLDGLSSAAFAAASHTHTASQITDFDEAAQDAVGGILTDSSQIDFTYDDAANTITAIVKNSSILFAHIQDFANTARLFGRRSAGSGAGQECTITQALDFVGTTAQGDVLYRDAAAWANLGAGTAGRVLKTGGAGANPSWGDVDTIANTLKFTGTITPTAIAANQVDYNPTGLSGATRIRLATNPVGSSFTIGGLQGGVDGRIVIIENINAAFNGWIQLIHEDASSAAANRFTGPQSNWITLQPGYCVILIYDGATSRWRVLAWDFYATAVKAGMEVGTDAAAVVTPSVFQYHPSTVKAWGQTTGGGTPSLTTNYNMTSITDTAAGRLTVTIATDFSSANWAGTSNAVHSTTTRVRPTGIMTKAAGSAIIEAVSAIGTPGTLADPEVGWDWGFFGDQ